MEHDMFIDDGGMEEVCEEGGDYEYIQGKMLEMQLRINELETQNAQLRKNLDFKEQLLVDASNAIVETNGGHNKRAARAKRDSDKYIQMKAKWLFYKEHKADGEIVAPLESEIRTYKIKPLIWRNVKMATDALFNGLQEQEKSRYTAMARNMIASS